MEEHWPPDAPPLITSVPPGLMEISSWSEMIALSYFQQSASVADMLGRKARCLALRDQGYPIYDRLEDVPPNPPPVTKEAKERVCTNYRTTIQSGEDVITGSVIMKIRVWKVDGDHRP